MLAVYFGGSKTSKYTFLKVFFFKFVSLTNQPKKYIYEHIALLNLYEYAHICPCRSFATKWKHKTTYFSLYTFL